MFWESVLQVLLSLFLLLVILPFLIVAFVGLLLGDCLWLLSDKTRQDDS